MPEVARIGDVVLSISPCSCHKSPKNFSGIILTGSDDVIASSSGVALLGSIASSTCGHIITLIASSTTVRANGIGIHRKGELGINCGGTSMTVTASNTVLAGG